VPPTVDALVAAMLAKDPAVRLRADVQALLDGEHPSDAISLLETGLDRAVPVPSWSCRCDTR
jgi:hypothetical protein